MTLCMVYGILNYDMFYIYIYFKIENKVIVNFMKWNSIVIEIVTSKEMTMYCTQRHINQIYSESTEIYKVCCHEIVCEHRPFSNLCIFK